MTATTSALLLLQGMGPVAGAPMSEIKQQKEEDELQPSTSAGRMWRPQPADAAAEVATGPEKGGQEPRPSPGLSAQTLQLQNLR